MQADSRGRTTPTCHKKFPEDGEEEHARRKREEEEAKNKRKVEGKKAKRKREAELDSLQDVLGVVRRRSGPSLPCRPYQVPVTSIATSHRSRVFRRERICLSFDTLPKYWISFAVVSGTNESLVFIKNVELGRDDNAL